MTIAMTRPPATSAFTPRPYQEAAFEAIRGEFLGGRKSTLLILPTGMGKTLCFGMVARWAIEDVGGRVLVLAHRDVLIRQAVDKLERVGIPCAVEKADQDAWEAMERDGRSTFSRGIRCVVASVQSLHAKRLMKRPRDFFRVIVTDECFPAGTMVDGRPIESVRVGDMVRSVNHRTGFVEFRPVVRLFRSRPSGVLLRLSFDDGTALVCTPGHPLFVMESCDYTPAEEIPVGSHVSKKEWYLAETDPFTLFQLRDSGRDRVREPQVGVPSERERLLLGGVQGNFRQSALVGADGGDESGPRFGPDEGQESDARRGASGADDLDAQADRPQASGSGWQWEGADWSPEDARGGVGLADGGVDPDRALSGRVGIPDLLQGGHRQLGHDGRDRGGRPVARPDEPSGAGPEERILPGIPRLVRVEVLQPGGDGEFGGVCPGGVVYNLEVEGNHNYFADDVLVHNCHHAVCDTYTRIYRHFSTAWHLGVTATGDRVDGDNLGRVFASKAFEIRLGQGIRDRWLAPVVVAKCDQKIDLRGISVVAGDFNRGELEDRISRNIEPLVAGAKAKIGARKAVVFCPYVLSARAFADGLRQVGVSARAVWGEAWDKEETLAAFHEGEFQCLVNVGIATEGWDEPAVSAVVLARPTKSKNLLTQMIGRGTRLYDGKDDCLVIDYDWQVDEHKGDICKPVHLVAPEGADADVLSFAEAMVESGFQPDVLKAVEEAQAQKAEKRARQEAKAKEELRARQERERLRIAVRDRESRLTWTHSSLVGLSAADILRVRPGDELPGRSSATGAQVAVLLRHGVSEAEALGMTEREATENILALNRREDEGMATLRQVGRLMRDGWTRERAWRLTKAEASWEIDMASRRGNASA